MFDKLVNTNQAVFMDRVDGGGALYRLILLNNYALYLNKHKEYLNIEALLLIWV